MSESVLHLKEILLDIRDLLYLNKTVFNVLSKSKIYKLTSLDLIPTGSNKNIRQKFFNKEDIDRWLLGKPDLSDELLEEEFSKQLLRNKKA